MVEPDNLTLTLLRELRAQVDERFEALEGRMDARPDKIERRRELLETVQS